jgi:hypothetical protein
MCKDMAAKYCIIYQSLRTSFFVQIKGCVNFHETSPVHKKRLDALDPFVTLEGFLKTTASLSNLIPPVSNYLTNSVNIS